MAQETGDTSSRNVGELIKSLDRLILGCDIVAAEHIPSLAEQLMDDPESGLKRIFETYGRVTRDAYPGIAGVYCGWAGGPHESFTWSLYNAVGAVYPYLDRRGKNIALKQLLTIFDGLNCGIVNGARAVGHTTGIREPLLLSDVSIVNPVYWCGLDEGKLILQVLPEWSDIQEQLIDENGMFNPQDVHSDFCVAWSLLKSNFCSHGEEYVAVANPAFLDRTLRGIVAMRFARYRGNKPDTKEEIEKGRQRLFEVLPRSLHDRIDPIRIEADWANPADFYYEGELL